MLKKTLSTKVLQRFMTNEEYIEFSRKYEESKLNAAGGNRFVNMAKPIMPEELTILKAYFDEKNQTIKSAAPTVGIPSNIFQSRVDGICRRLVFQNKDKLL